MDDSDIWASQIINEILEEYATEKTISEGDLELLLNQNESLSYLFCDKEGIQMGENTSDEELSAENKYQKCKTFKSSSKSQASDHHRLSEGNLYFPSAKEEFAVFHSEPYISRKDFSFAKEKYAPTMDKYQDKNSGNIAKEKFRKPSDTLASVGHKATEKDNVHRKQNKSLEKFYDCDSQPFLNLEHHRGNGIHRIHKMQVKKRKNIFSGGIEGDALKDFRIKDSFESEVTPMHIELKPSKERFPEIIEDEVDQCLALLEEDLENCMIDNLSESSDNETLKPRNLVMVEIYRKVVNFFEICLVSPTATILENHLEILEFILALVICTIYMYYTNIKSKLVNSKPQNKKKPVSKHVALPIHRSDCISESIRTDHFNVKESRSVESLIAFSSDSNSNEDIKNTYDEAQEVFYSNSSDYMIQKFDEDCANIRNEKEFDLLSGEIKHEENKSDCLTKTILDVDKTGGNLEEDEAMSPNFPWSFDEYLKEISAVELNSKPFQEYIGMLKDETENSQFKYEEDSFIAEDSISCKEVKDTHTENYCLVSPIIGIDVNDVIENTDGTTYSSLAMLYNEYLEEISDLDLNSKSCQSSLEILELDGENKKSDFKESYTSMKIKNERNTEENEVEVDNSRVENHCLTSAIIDESITNNVFIMDETKLPKLSTSSNKVLSGISIVDSNCDHLNQLSETEQSEAGNMLSEFKENASSSRENHVNREAIQSKNCNLKELLLETQPKYKILKCDNVKSDNVSLLDPEIEMSSEIDSKEYHGKEVLIETSSETSAEKYEVQDTKQKSAFITNQTYSFGEMSTSNITFDSNSRIKSLIDNQMSVKRNTEGLTDDVYTPMKYRTLDGEIYTEYDETVIKQFIEEFSVEETVQGSDAVDTRVDDVCTVRKHSDEYNRTITTYTLIGEFDEADEMELRSYQTYLNQSKTVAEYTKMTMEEKFAEAKSSCSHSKDLVESMDTKNIEVFYTQRDLSISSMSLDDSDFLDVSLEVNRSFQSLQTLESSEGNRQDDTTDAESKRYDGREGFHNKLVHLSQLLSTSMPNVQDMNSDENLPFYETTGKVLSNFQTSSGILPNIETNSLEGCMFEPSLGLSRRSQDEWETTGCFQNFPDIFSIRETRSNERSDEEFRCLPSFASEPFEFDSQSPKDAIAAFSSEVNADRRKHKKRNSFKSKVSSVFNGMKKLPGRFVSAASEVGSSYRKHKNEHSF